MVESTGARVQLIGVDYQPGGASGFDPTSGRDPLSDADICLRDATLMQRLGVNTIRIYNLDPDLNHDECASIFNAAGIYMILDVNSPLPNTSLNRGAPWESYNTDYLTRIFQVVEAFSPYPNTLAYFSGNEVINEDSVVQVPAYIRAVTRDLKEYISNHVDRAISVGYSAADVRDILSDTWSYLDCGLSNDTMSKIDFFGLNSYSWCGDSSFQTSGYDVLVQQFANTTIPVFFSEYGCNKVQPRIFTEVPVLYGPQMSVFSGGLIYEFTQEENDFGLIQINDNNTVSLLADYANLQKQYSSLDLKALTAPNTTATSQTAPDCSADLITTSSFLNHWDLPARPSGADDLIRNGVPNANKGKLVDVTNLSPKHTVYDAQGNEIQGLALKKLGSDQSNLPGENVSGSSTSGGSPSGTQSGGSASATSSQGAAVSVMKEGRNSAVAMVGAGLLGFLLS